MRILFVPQRKQWTCLVAGSLLALLVTSCDRPAQNENALDAYRQASTSTAPASATAPAATTSPPAAINPPVAAGATAAPVPGAATAIPAAAPVVSGGVVVTPPPTGNVPTAAPVVATNAAATNIAAMASTNAVPGTNAAAKPAPEPLGRDEEIQLSFQGANIDIVVQWLAKTTGKSVVKHPRVTCQLTIVSSKKTTARDAINLVYRALSLEGFATIESSNSILIVPEGSEPKLSPALMDTASNEVPDGRQRLMKVFPLQHISPTEAKEKLKVVISEKGTVDADERGGRIIVTDYTDNLRLVIDLLPELDVVSVSDTVIHIFPLKFLQADELASLLELVLNEKAGTPASPSRSSPTRSSRSYSSSGLYFMESMPSSPSPSPSPTTSPAADGKIKLWPDKNSNRLIVSAPRSKIPEIEKLIGVLDTAKPADVAIRVIPLKHVNAVDLARELAPVYQKLGGQSAKDLIEITSNERANSLIVLSSQANFKGIQDLVAGLDTEEAQERLLRTFTLQNADAEDVAEQLRQLNTDPNPFPRFFYYGMPSQTRSGKLSVVADRRRNTVIAQGPAASMEGIAEMIAALDAPVEDNSLAPKIFPLRYVSAVDIVDVLNELFLKKQQPRTYWNPYSDFGNQTEKDPNVGRLYGKVRITSEPYANALIVTANSPENLSAVEEIVKQLDVPSQAGESTVKLGLKFAEAVQLANSLNILFARGGSPPLRQVPQQGQQQDPRVPQNPNSVQGGFQLEQEKKEDTYFPWLGGQPENQRGPDGTTTMRPASELVGRVRVVPDNRSNALLITANVHFLPQVLKLINELDAPTAQVLIEAKIIEVSSDFRDRLGVRWSPDGTQVYDAEDLDGSIMPNISARYTRFLAGSGAGNSIDTGILDSTVNLDLLIQFLRRNTDATVLAQPQINVSDNELGKLFVGSQVPFISSSLNTSEGGRNDSFQYKDVGIILEVTPHINNAEEVSLKIHAESSNIRSGQTLFGGAILDTRNFHTDLLVKHGQTVVLGGIIQREEGTTIRKVPLLGDIPLMGWLFKKRDKVSRNVELMVFLRPRITRTPEEAHQLMHDVQEGTPKLRQFNQDTK